MVAIVVTCADEPYGMNVGTSIRDSTTTGEENKKD